LAGFTSLVKIDIVRTILDELNTYAKFNKALSFSAHVITAVFTGSILYVYDRISTEQELPNSHDMRLLCTALTLHDVNKYWNEISNSRNQGNYYNLIQDYFETDPFNIKAYFPEWESV